MHKIKIAYIITRSDTIAGSQVHLYEIARAAIERGHTVIVFVGQSGPFTDLLERGGINFISLKNLIRPISPLSDIKALIEIVSQLRKYSPDVLTLHSSKAGLLGRVAGRYLRIPTVFTAHGWAFSDGVNSFARFIFILIERITASLADRIITVSDYDHQLAIRHNVADPMRLVTVHNGISEIANDHLANPGTSLQRMIMVARFDAQKDHETLIMALSKLTDLPWQLDLVGDGPLMEKTQKLVNKLGITERVHFLGARSDVPTLLANAQIFLLISNYEGFPLSIIEGMRAGLPVIASDVGGCRESVIDGQTGFLIPRGDGTVLFEKLQQLLLDPTLRTHMGSAGRVRYETEFTLEKMYQKTFDVYIQAIANHST
jgi:glycosyltransferase involved in cell wall biosynthesis